MKWPTERLLISPSLNIFLLEPLMPKIQMSRADSNSVSQWYKDLPLKTLRNVV